MSDRYGNFLRSDFVYGQLYGEQCLVSRVGASSKTQDPDFTIINQAASTIATYKYYIETTTAKYVQINAPDVEWYTLKGKRGVLKPGDIIRPTGIRKNRFSTNPDITFINTMSFGIAVGFKSTRVGAIYSGNTLIYDNIRFDYLPRSAFPGAPLDREVEASLGVPSIQVVLFKRDLYTQIRDGEGLFLYQTDTDPQLIWQVTQVVELQAGQDTFGNQSAILILDLKRNVVS